MILVECVPETYHAHDDFGRGRSVLAWRVLKAWSVVEDGTFEWDDGYGTVVGRVVRLSDGSEARQYVNRIDYTGGERWTVDAEVALNKRWLYRPGRLPTSLLDKSGQPMSAEARDFFKKSLDTLGGV